MMKFTKKICLWATSYAVIIPPAMMKEMGWQETDMLDLSVEGDRVIMTKAKPKRTLFDLKD